MGNDLDCVSAGSIGDDSWEVRVCDTLVWVQVRTWMPGGIVMTEQALTVPPAVADALGPALVAAAKRVRGNSEGGADCED